MVDVPPGPLTPPSPWRLPEVVDPRPDKPRPDKPRPDKPRPDAPRPDVAIPPQTLRAAIAGDEVAFAVLFTELHPRLRRYARVLVGQQADDVVAEAWLHIARDIRTFRGDVDGFRAWCARIVRNRAVDLLRHDGRRPAQPQWHDDRLDSVAPDNTEIDALDNIATTRALALIASLPQEQAEAVLLRAVVGVDTRAAAEILGKSPGAVRVAAHRGLRRLARTLADLENNGGPT